MIDLESRCFLTLTPPEWQWVRPKKSLLGWRVSVKKATSKDAWSWELQRFGSEVAHIDTSVCCVLLVKSTFRVDPCIKPCSVSTLCPTRSCLACLSVGLMAWLPELPAPSPPPSHSHVQSPCLYKHQASNWSNEPAQLPAHLHPAFTGPFEVAHLYAARAQHGVFSSWRNVESWNYKGKHELQAALFQY
jgi:hypothetical protein